MLLNKLLCCTTVTLFAADCIQPDGCVRLLHAAGCITHLALLVPSSCLLAFACCTMSLPQLLQAGGGAAGGRSCRLLVFCASIGSEATVLCPQLLQQRPVLDLLQTVNTGWLCSLD